MNEFIKRNRNKILAIAKKHGAYNIRVFGSMARGDATQDSDVDLLVNVGKNRTPFFPAGLLIELEEALGRKVDVVTDNGLHWYIKEKVLKEAQSL